MSTFTSITPKSSLDVVSSTAPHSSQKIKDSITSTTVHDIKHCTTSHCTVHPCHSEYITGSAFVEFGLGEVWSKEIETHKLKVLTDAKPTRNERSTEDRDSCLASDRQMSEGMAPMKQNVRIDGNDEIRNNGTKGKGCVSVVDPRRKN